MILIVSLLARLGLSQRAAQALAPFALAGAAAVLLVGGFLLWDHFDDKAAIEQHEAERERKAIPAREKAADERVDDALRNTRSEEELHDAIHDAEDSGAPSPAAHALACERLRRVGRIPPSCRPAGGDRGEAAAD